MRVRTQPKVVEIPVRDLKDALQPLLGRHGIKAPEGVRIKGMRPSFGPQHRGFHRVTPKLNHVALLVEIIGTGPAEKKKRRKS